MLKPRLRDQLLRPLLLVGGFYILVLTIAFPILHQFMGDFGTILFLAAALTIWGVSGWVFGRRLLAPLERLAGELRRFGKGQEFRSIPVAFSSDPGGLVRISNKMVERVNRRLLANARALREQEAVFASMRDGVVAISHDGRVLRLNAAARELCGVTLHEVERRNIEEVFRNSEIQRFIRRAMATIDSLDEELTIYGENSEILLRATSRAVGSQEKARSAENFDPDDEFGTLVVLSNISELRKLENVRRDFVSNVSHELRTPITAIKGYAETILDSMNSASAEENERYLRIILRQADRLNMIFNDLLSLARLESASDQEALSFENFKVADLVRLVIESSSIKAAERGVRLAAQEPLLEDMASINPSLLEQALANLVDNAINYTERGGSVTMRLLADSGLLRIEVEDTGCGIDEAHQRRIFERFYRVDRARSRKLGGTGLGLSIVKHIAQAHGGSVGVRSEVGKGSCFWISIPVGAHNE